MQTYSDYRPHDYVAGECLDCGFCYSTTEGLLTLQEVNERRQDEDLEVIKSLKAQSSEPDEWDAWEAEQEKETA